MHKLTAKVAIVTGAGGGIGAAVASLLSQAGAAVAVVDCRGEAALAVANEIALAGGHARAYTLDVSDPHAVTTCWRSVADRLGGIDILVNNAGVGTVSTIADLSDEDWRRVIDINLSGPFYCMRAAIPHMQARGGGAIVNVASIAGKRMSYHGAANYTAAKSGLLGLTRHAAFELAAIGVRVNAVCPGPVLTPMVTRTTTAREREHTAGLIPLGRWIEPEDVARTVLFLAGPDSGMCTGSDVDVDGGMLVSNGVPMAQYLSRRTH